MYIYNVTTNIQESVHDEWIKWMQEKHIPDVLATGKFLSAKMSKVLVEEDMGGITYSVQFTTTDKETLKKYYENDAPRLREEVQKLFSGKFVSFRTELEVLSDHSAEKLSATEYIFTYGTLHDEDVQLANFNRKLDGFKDALQGYRISERKIANQYTNIEPSGKASDIVSGTCYLLTPTELLAADAYEGQGYQREKVHLVSGKKAWVYRSKNNPSSNG